MTEYKKLIDNNFEPLRNSFTLYSRLPVTVIVEWDRDDNVPLLTYAIGKSSKMKVHIIMKGTKSIFDPKTLTVEIKGKKKRWVLTVDSYTRISFKELLPVNVVEDWCYNVISRELANAITNA